MGPHFCYFRFVTAQDLFPWQSSSSIDTPSQYPSASPNELFLGFMRRIENALEMKHVVKADEVFRTSMHGP